MSYIDEEWIYDCVELDKLKKAIEKIKKDASKQSLLSIAEKRKMVLENGPAPDEKKEAEQIRIQGNNCVKNADYKNAMTYYTKSIKLDPTEAGTFGNRSLTHQRLNDGKRAVEDAKRAIIINPDFSRGYQRLAEAFMLEKKYQKAYAAVRAMLTKDPSSKPGNALLKDIKNTISDKGIEINESEATKEANNFTHKKFDSDEGAEPMEDVKAPAGSVNNNEIEKFFAPCNKIKAVAKECHRSGRFDDALSHYKKCFELMERMEDKRGSIPLEEFQRREAILNNNIAVCYKQKQDQDSIITYSSKVIECPVATNDMKLKAYILRAFAYESIDRIKRAKEDWIKVKELQPGNFDASKALARIASALKEDEEQQKLDVIGEAVRGLEAFKLKGNEYYKAKNYTEAINQFTLGIDKFRSSIKLEDIKKLGPRAAIVCQLYTNRSLCYYLQEMNDKSAKDADTVIRELDPSNVKAYFRKGLALKKLGKHSEAVKNLQKAVSLDPSNDLYSNALKEAKKH